VSARAACWGGGARRARGQAMTEFVVGAVLFLVPLFLIVPTLAKYLDGKAMVTLAARYAAWERTVWYGGASSSVSWPGNSKSEGTIRNEIRQRIFSQDTSIAGGDGGAGDWGGDGQKVFWYNRDSSPMLASYDAVSDSVQNQDTPGIVNDLLNLVVTVTDALGTFTLETKGLYDATVTMDMGAQKVDMSLRDDPTQSWNPGVLGIAENNAILANGWSANGPDHVKSQVKGLTPTGLLDPSSPLGIAMKAVQIALVPFAPELLFLEFGKIEPDIVPPDRLTN